MSRGFGKRLDDLSDVLLRNVTKTVRKAGQAAANEVILRTPVKTGRARINWQTSFGKVKATNIKPPNTARRDTNKQVASTKALIDATNVLKNWKVGRGNIFIANPVDYIVDLDRGSSRQARSGMTMFGVAAARTILKQGRLLKDGR